MRTDVSAYLVHWTRGSSEQEAFSRLSAIVREARITGGSDSRKGLIPSVCFTEAPVDEFVKFNGRYSEFGIQVTKKWAFSMGARPVIYQRDSEYGLLPETLRWRHVRYEPDATPSYDFTWEREWRAPVEILSLAGSAFSILIPSVEWLEVLKQEHYARESWRISGEAQAFGDGYGWQSPTPFLYNVQIKTA